LLLPAGCFADHHHSWEFTVELIWLPPMPKEKERKKERRGKKKQRKKKGQNSAGRGMSGFVVKTLNAMSGGTSIDGEFLSPDEYLEREFEPKSTAGPAFDENTRHLARLVLDCDERSATVGDVVNFVWLVQCALRSAFAGFGRLYAVLTTSRRGGFHIHFPDVVFAVHPLQRVAGDVQMPLVVYNLLRWMRCQAGAMFATPPSDPQAAAKGEPHTLRVDVDALPLSSGVRCRIFGTERTDLADVEPADTRHSVVAVVDESGTVHRMSDPNNAASWWQQLRSAAVPPLTLGSLSVRPNSAQVARFMLDPVANRLRMVRGAPLFVFNEAKPCELECAALAGEELAALFFPTHEQPHLIAGLVELRFVSANMALAVCRREPGDGIDCVVCRLRGAACGGTQLRSLVRWHPFGGKARAGDIWQCCDAAPDLVESVTRPDCRVLVDEWRVRSFPLVRLPFGTAAPRALAVEHVTSLPLLPTVYERGFELGGGVRTHTAADADASVEFVDLVRSMAAAESVSLSGAESALIRSVPMVERAYEYTPSLDDPDEERKPRVAAVFADQIQPRCDGDLVLTSIRAPPGYGKTYLLKELICSYFAKYRKGSLGRPLLVLMVTALRNVNVKLRVDVSEQLQRAGLRASVSFYADDSGRVRDDKWWQPSLGGPFDVLVRITSCNSIVRSVQSGVRPHLLLIDESEHAVAYSATAGTLGGTVYHGRVAPLHEEVCQALWSAAAKTRFEVVLVDRDAGFNARLCAASVALQCVIQARQRGRTFARSLSYRDLRLTVRIPRSYVVLPAGDDDVLLALLRELVIDKGERVIVADMSAKHAKDLDRRLRSAIADEHQPDGPYPNVGLLHGKLDKNFLNFVASDPLRYCTRELIAALIHTPVLSRGSSLDVPYFDCNVLVARACASRNEAAQGEDRQRLTRSQLETGMRTTYIQFSRSMMTSPELVHYFADVTLGVALYACNERLLQQHREADSVPSAMVHALQSLRAVQYDATDGRPYIELSSRIAITALINIAREWLARQLHYHVFLQECRDDGATVSDLPDAQLAVLRESASRQGDADSNRKAVVYDELCKAPLNERDDVKIAGLCAPSSL
jgi:hypothetical protein